MQPNGEDNWDDLDDGQKMEADHISPWHESGKTVSENKVTKKDLEKEFGADVARMVNDVTEQDRELPWIERKKAALDHIPNMPGDSLLVKSADVLDNLSDQLEDYKQLGDEMFESFNATKKQQLDRYEKLLSALEKAGPESPFLLSLKESVAQAKSLWT